MNNDVFHMDFTKTLPPALKQDEKMQALSRVIADALEENARLICKNIIYAGIDEMPEKLLDILAYDLHVDWYDYDSSVEVKRELIKTSVKVHKKLGTVYAVETAIKALHGDCKIEEWFEYGGEPFCFRLILNLDKGNLQTGIEDIIKRVYMCKRLTAHLDGIMLEKKFQHSLFFGGAQTQIIREAMPVKKYTKHTGFTGKVHTGIAKIERVSVNIAARRTENRERSR